VVAFIVLILLGWTLVLVLAVLRRLLATPGRAAEVSVRPLPWPRVEIRVDGGPIGCTCRAQSPPPADIDWIKSGDFRG
jgi:hypothetical protein